MRVIVSVFSNLFTDQRVEKTCQTLIDQGYDVELIGNNWGGALEMQRHYPITRISLTSKSLKFAYPEFMFKLYKELKKRTDKNSVLYSNDLETLIPNFKIAEQLNIPLVFDSHEMFSEMPSVQGKISQKIWKWVERNYFPKLNNIITASDSYADWFVKEYDIARPMVVRNLPRQQYREQQESKSQKIILYQGWLNYSRGIDKAIMAMQYVENAVLKIAGGGPMEAEFRAIAKQYDVLDKVEFLGKLYPSDLRKITPTADVGLSIEENKGLSYYYSLPNKISDYIQAKVPVVVSDFPELKKIALGYQVGETIENHDPKHLAEKINLVLNKGKIFYKKNLDKAAQELSWEHEEQKIIKVLEQAIHKK
ncbi:glycosyltransferase family 4 protein [Chryseobacterium sp. POL2]|uniref:glycosyltransferase n=1 Tax=Chryseobacterium sp. POL2 TaxID=2713414 RepID=UPI0013E1F912|nr:glycosyltransferase [Chryseobacterium sp. POL2]QIG90003.1 glycosyltransferase family 4 protein [Chryseobacterium sp. POL2]